MPFPILLDTQVFQRSSVLPALARVPNAATVREPRRQECSECSLPSCSFGLLFQWTPAGGSSALQCSPQPPSCPARLPSGSDESFSGLVPGALAALSARLEATALCASAQVCTPTCGWLRTDAPGGHVCTCAEGVHSLAVGQLRCSRGVKACVLCWGACLTLRTPSLSQTWAMTPQLRQLWDLMWGTLGS
ncbi:Hypothetical predicted protein [Marmota monax]|uniref:Uncharacterized protein n=1 Tax=Marmota monax TaxID=9995 RepID=A0A5E4AKN9_MARMO|nr:Hypothetical predicted protein [Marmota monax]